MSEEAGTTSFLARHLLFQREPCCELVMQQHHPAATHHHKAARLAQFWQNRREERQPRPGDDFFHGSSYRSLSIASAPVETEMV
jgi:hypothetical protein